MFRAVKTKSIYELSMPQKLLFGALVFICGVVIFILFPPQALDWRYTFYPVSQIPLHPYSIRTFVNPPWTALILYPLHFFSENASSAINSSLNLVVFGLLVIKRKGDILSLFLTLTSYPFLLLLANGSIEWLPALGFILQNAWGLPLVLTKPQSGGVGTLAWFLPVKKKIVFLAPVFITSIASFIIWGNWFAAMMSNIHYMNDAKVGLFIVSIAPYPWAIPLGLGIIFYILKYKPDQSEILGSLSTFCLVPYFVPHSLTIFFALLSVSHRRVAILLWLLLWLPPMLRH